MFFYQISKKNYFKLFCKIQGKVKFSSSNIFAIKNRNNNISFLEKEEEDWFVNLIKPCENTSKLNQFKIIINFIYLNFSKKIVCQII